MALATNAHMMAPTRLLILWCSAPLHRTVIIFMQTDW